MVWDGPSQAPEPEHQAPKAPPPMYSPTEPPPMHDPASVPPPMSAPPASARWDHTSRRWLVLGLVLVLVALVIIVVLVVS